MFINSVYKQVFVYVCLRLFTKLLGVAVFVYVCLQNRIGESVYELFPGRRRRRIFTLKPDF